MEYELPGGDGRITKFSGTRLAHASSRRDDDQLRWTEISIYRTDGGNYVVHKVGKSIVAHMPGQDCTSGVEVSARAPAVGDAKPCPKCKPVLGAYPGVVVVLEQDRHTVHVALSAEGAVESCHTQDDDQSVYLTNAARQALQDASAVDSVVAEAFTVQRVD